MLRNFSRSVEKNEAGQALPLFGLFLVVLIGFVAMSIDVGRYVWARTSMQAGVDAAALAAAQSMPDWADAQAKAATYWTDNSGFIQSQGTNVSFTVEQVPGNKRIRITGNADVPTWFARVFGMEHWHVSASGDAEAQVLDIAVVLDISGSMCYDPPMLHTESSESQLMSPGHYSPASNRPTVKDGNYTGAGDNTATDIVSGGGSSITIKLNDGANMSEFATNDRIVIHSGLNGTGSYEIFKITALSSANKSLTLTRSQTNNFTGAATSKISHPIGAEIWQNRTVCADAVRLTTPPYGAYPFDPTIASAEYFTTLFNPSYDKIGVAKFSTNTASVTALSSSLSTVKTTIHSLAPPSGSTNMAGGISAGRLILDGAGKRANAVRVMVLLTDGIANYVCGNNSSYATSDYNSLPCSSTYSTGEGATADSHAYSEATRAKNGDIMIFVIGLGDGVQDSFLKRIADGGVAGSGPCQQNQSGCRYYKAPTTAQLDDAFKAIAEQTHIALVK